MPPDFPFESTTMDCSISVTFVVRWYQPANALINHFYFKKLVEISGCTSMSACNYNPEATKDDGNCKPAKDGFDCSGKALSKDATGATFFIRTQKPVQLTKSFSHAEVDLPENFEVGFEITPQKTPVKAWSNIIHFTATGKVFVKSSGHCVSYCFFVVVDMRYSVTVTTPLWCSYINI